MNKDQSLPAWGAWIEIIVSGRLHRLHGSLPAWGAWIEIAGVRGGGDGWSRSPHGERGLKFCGCTRIWVDGVAPRMGSVD